MRGLVNAFGAWFDSGHDAFDETVRFLAMFAVIGGAVVLVIGVGAVALIALFGAPSQPQLFCRNGTEIHSEPATRVIGKVPVAGVRFTCD